MVQPGCFRFGIRANAIAPGYLDTELNTTFWDSEAGKAMTRRIPQRGLGRLEDLDGPLMLLASPVRYESIDVEADRNAARRISDVPKGGLYDIGARVQTG